MFTNFSSDTWNNWEASGEAEVREKIKQYLNDDPVKVGICIPQTNDNLSMVLYEVILAVVKELITKDQVKPLLTEMLPWHPELGSILVEVISVVEMDVAPTEVKNKSRDLLLGLIKILPLEKLFKERLEIDTLGDALIIKNKKNFLTKQIKVRTKMYYKQQKYNLLREESEGYGKLITELNQEISDRVTPASIIQVIRSLIGTFNLDPNRVLDLILEAFECRPEEKRFYTNLLKRFPHESSTVCELLGFKLNYYRDFVRDSRSAQSDDDEAGHPRGVFVVIALLLQANIITLDNIYEWLTPDDKTLIEEHQKEMSSAELFASRANVVSTKDKEQPEGGGGGGGKDRDKEAKDRDGNREEKEREKSNDWRSAKSDSNHKIQLAIALIEVGNWSHFLELSSRFPESYLVSCQPISVAFCSLVNTLIDPFYLKLSQLPPRIRRKAPRRPKGYLTLSPVGSVDELCSAVLPMLSVLGAYLAADVALLYKILRLARAILAPSLAKTGNGAASGTPPVPTSPDARRFYFDFMTTLDVAVLPALSMFDSNPCLAEEIWETIKLYPYQYRYKMYARWKDETYLQYPTLIRNRTTLLKKAKYTMMRITKETIKPVSRSIGKQTHNFPGPVFEYVLKQVQIYDNLINPVVDSFKYLTSLSYDVLAFCIVEILTLSTDRTQNDVMAISPMFQSLSGFCGSLSKKYAMDLAGILDYVANQLKSENSIDLLILKDVVQKMGGTDSMENLTPDQLDAMCGWEHLRREAGQYLQEKNTKRSSMRLKDTLIENNLGIPLLILMAQQRSSIVYNQKESPHLKLVGKLYDQCQDTLIQFGSFLFQMMSEEELIARLPSIGELLSDFHLNADMAFFFSRPFFSHSLQNKYEEMRKKCKTEKKEQFSDADKKRAFSEAMSHVLAPLSASIQPQYSPKIWEDMDPSFFLAFWLLRMSDLQVPVKIYDKEIEKLQEMSTAKLRKRELERVQSLKEKLEEEKRRQGEHVDRINCWLAEKSETWFTSTIRSQNTANAFLQLCIFPRCTFSTLDAIYCARFVKLLHSLKTPNFSSLICYDKLYCDITYTVTSCTEQEAHNYARFLLDTLTTVMHWHKSAENFEKECARFPGFITRYRISTKEANDYVDYENFRHVVHKWHYKITKALVTCLESGDYIQIRNAILVLQGTLTQFPAIANLCPVIEKRIEKVKKTEKGVRNDLFVLANSYSGRLKAKKPHLMPESKFHLVGKKPDSAAAAAQKTPAKTAEPAKQTKREANGEVNGNASDVEDAKGKPPAKKQCTQNKTDENATKDDKRKKEKEDKDGKRKRDAKKEKTVDDGDSPASEENGTTNGAAPSKKVPPSPVERVDSNRSAKRRKPDHETKSSK